MRIVGAQNKPTNYAINYDTKQEHHSMKYEMDNVLYSSHNTFNEKTNRIFKANLINYTMALNMTHSKCNYNYILPIVSNVISLEMRGWRKLTPLYYRMI